MVSINTSSRLAKAVLFAGALFVLTPCAPQPSPVFSSTGTWLGPITDDSIGTGTFDLVLPPPGTDQIHRGTWSATWSPPSTPRSLGGSATAPATGNQLRVQLACTSAVLATLTVVIEGTRMTGSYTPCDTLSRGTVDLIRQ
jgi:hypothetical protein